MGVLRTYRSATGWSDPMSGVLKVYVQGVGWVNSVTGAQDGGGTTPPPPFNAPPFGSMQEGDWIELCYSQNADRPNAQQECANYWNDHWTPPGGGGDDPTTGTFANFATDTYMVSGSSVSWAQFQSSTNTTFARNSPKWLRNSAGLLHMIPINALPVQYDENGNRAGLLLEPPYVNGWNPPIVSGGSTPAMQIGTFMAVPNVSATYNGIETGFSWDTWLPITDLLRPAPIVPGSNFQLPNLTTPDYAWAITELGTGGMGHVGPAIPHGTGWPNYPAGPLSVSVFGRMDNGRNGIGISLRATGPSARFAAIVDLRDGSIAGTNYDDGGNASSDNPFRASTPVVYSEKYADGWYRLCISFEHINQVPFLWGQVNVCSIPFTFLNGTAQAQSTVGFVTRVFNWQYERIRRVSSVVGGFSTSPTTATWSNRVADVLTVPGGGTPFGSPDLNSSVLQGQEGHGILRGFTIP